MAASNSASWRWAADGPGLTRPKVASRTRRRQPRSGSCAARVGTGATAASAQGSCGTGTAGAGSAEGAACRNGAAGRGGAGGAAGVGCWGEGGTGACCGGDGRYRRRRRGRGMGISRAGARRPRGRGVGLVGLQTLPQEFVALVHGLLECQAIDLRVWPTAANPRVTSTTARRQRRMRTGITQVSVTCRRDVSRMPRKLRGPCCRMAATPWPPR
jgi:hypothetical protein